MRKHEEDTRTAGRELEIYGVRYSVLLSVGIALLVGMVAWQALLIPQIAQEISNIEFAGAASLAGGSASAGRTATTAAGGATDVQAVMARIIPTGKPPYGDAAGVTYDNINGAISVLAGYDNSIKLSGAELDRYIRIASRISCEFCCGAPAVIDSRGNAACGCAHSAAMRGVAKFLIRNFPNDYTDAQILEEMTKWKTLFFPRQMVERALQAQAASGSIDVSTLSRIPQQVGGC
ncbi:MAG: hypothetical protein QXH27_03890 [Candidatus Micrarchaeia archaeon]